MRSLKCTSRPPVDAAGSETGLPACPNPAHHRPMAISKKTGQKVRGGRIGDAKLVRNLLSMKDALNRRRMEAADCWYHLRVQFEGGQEKDLLFTPFEIARAMKRAKENPEDIPKVNVIRNLLD